MLYRICALSLLPNGRGVEKSDLNVASTIERLAIPRIDKSHLKDKKAFG